MKRFISVLALCSALLLGLSLVLFPPVKAKEDPIAVLLTLPAPPPPNPLVPPRRVGATKNDKNNPPPDNAPIDELVDYWQQEPREILNPTYHPEMSEKTLDRLLSEIKRDPSKLPSLVDSLPESEKAAALVKELFDREGTKGIYDRDDRDTIKRWLTYRSTYYLNDLYRLAQSAGDNDNNYVDHQEDLLALARLDYDRAEPMINRMLANPRDKASNVLARWARYRHAIDTKSLDVEQYRDELKAIVEDKSLSDPTRDLAMDALVTEKEWPGRDEWYLDRLSDPTLTELDGYTGLTTIITTSRPGRYADKMVELLASSDRNVRSAAIRNLTLEVDPKKPEIIRALLPWLEDPSWAKDAGNSRQRLVSALREIEMPESVPGLIKILDEKQKRPVPNRMATNAAKPANAVTVANRAPRDADNANTSLDPGVEMELSLLRISAVSALANQKDPRAVPALRRVLTAVEGYERGGVVKAILECGGFTVLEQLDALALAAKGVRAEIDREGAAANAVANYYGYGYNTNVAANYSGYANAPARSAQIMAAEIKQLLAQQLLQSTGISDDLARGLVDRIEGLDKTDPQMSAAYRRMILRWQNAAINLLLLSDLKRGVADADTILRLLSQRKELRERQEPDVSDIRNGTPTAVGISACLIEDAGDYDSILDGSETEAKIAMLSCARLIRAKLPVEKVAANLNTATPALTIAAERYLESEDSPLARTIVLSRHPGEAKVLGARSAFDVEGVESGYSEYLSAVYMSVENDSLYNGWRGSGNDADLMAVEKDMRAEVKKDNTLLGIYAYDSNFVRIYNDRVMFSWNEDESRFREKPLSKGEFDEIKEYLVATRADELPPFLSCGGAYCIAKELLMVGRNGGRRVYTNTDDVDFFTGLDKIFADFKRTPATLRYTLSRDIPGLEIMLASDDLHVSTVWKNGDDLRVCASQTAVRKKVKDEIDKIGEAAEDEELDEAEVSAAAEKKTTETDRRQWEGYAWYRIAGGSPVAAAQPPEAEFIPVRDGLSVQREQDAWKARAAGIEIRASENGLYKVVRRRVVQIAKGDHKWPVITANGRWVFAVRSDTSQLVRVDLLTNRQYDVDVEGYGEKYAQVFIPTLDKMLVVRSLNYNDGPYDEDTDEENDTTDADYDPGDLMFVEPATGMVIPVSSGELRPLAQQTFRPLQRSSLPDEFWAAMPDFEKNETRLGIYNAKWLTFTAVRTIPKIKFNSMNMWVDEAGNKVYFVYRGHLLALPLK